MAYDYDKLFASTPQALGEPAQVLVDFFKQANKKCLRVLDVGCGQGRDALFIARLGHQVVGVDLSPNGIADLLKAATKEKLPVTGIATNIISYSPTGMFDVLLFDRTLHMLPEKSRLKVLKNLTRHVANKGWVVIIDEQSNMPGFKIIFNTDKSVWETALETKGVLFLQRSKRQKEY